MTSIDFGLISWIEIAQCAFVIILLLIRHEKVADYILCGWLGLLGIASSRYLTQQFVGNFWPLSLVLSMGISASLYLYSKYITGSNNKFQPRDLLHYLPSVLLLAFIFIFGKTSGSPNLNASVFVAKYKPVLLLFSNYYTYSTVFYLFFAVRNIVKFRKQVYDAYSYNKQQLKLNWLIVIYVFYIAHLAINFNIGKDVYFNSLTNNNINLMVIITLAMIYLLSFGGILQKQLVMADTSTKTKEEKVSSESSAKDDKAEESDKEALQPLADQLISYIESSRAWRDSELSIAKLSTATGIQKHIITQTLNEYLGKNFYTLINGYRIEEAKRMMHDEKYKNYTFMSIAYDCGFNSKTAFYTAFKKITGTTPTEYQKNA